VLFAVGLLVLAAGVHYTFKALHQNAESSTPPPATFPDSKLQLNSTVILISVDGARTEYFTRGLTPAFDRMAREGVRAAYMLSQFPTKTFPNHYTITTGLYPDAHGIVDNEFWDANLNETFSYHSNVSTTNGKWWGGEPVCIILYSVYYFHECIFNLCFW
jgi:predicted AlkP superfamily pyrophosphatase or phosphodiesterase